MKYLSTLIAIFTISVTTLWAQTPNPGFESWTSHTGYNTPNSWDNANSTTAITGVFTCIKSSTPHSGSFALELITQTYLGNTAPGIATTGTINTTTQVVNGGIPFTGRPDSIYGWYKYSSVSGDQGFVTFILFGTSNSDTVAQAYFSTPASNVSAWTRFSKALTYRNSHAVTNSQWIILSSLNQTTGKVGSTIYVDDIGLDSSATTGINTIQSAKELMVMPNPASNKVVVYNTVNDKSTFVLYDITGRKVMENTIGSSTNSIDVTMVPMGLYIYSIVDQNNTVIKTGKLVIQR